MVLLAKNPSVSAGEAGSIPGLGRCPGGGHGNPLQYSFLENPMDRGAWRATAHRFSKSLRRLKELSTLAWMFIRQTVTKSLCVTPTDTSGCDTHKLMRVQEGQTWDHTGTQCEGVTHHLRGSLDTPRSLPRRDWSFAR